MQPFGLQFREADAIVAGDRGEAEMQLRLVILDIDVERRAGSGRAPAQSRAATQATQSCIARTLLPTPPSPESSATLRLIMRSLTIQRRSGTGAPSHTPTSISGSSMISGEAGASSRGTSIPCWRSSCTIEARLIEPFGLKLRQTRSSRSDRSSGVAATRCRRPRKSRLRTCGRRQAPPIGSGCNGLATARSARRRGSRRFPA